MSITTVRYCGYCEGQRGHAHLHNTNGTRHVHGSERFVCRSCGKATFAHSKEAERFPFVVEVPERRSAFAHAMVRA